MIEFHENTDSNFFVFADRGGGRRRRPSSWDTWVKEPEVFTTFPSLRRTLASIKVTTVMQRTAQLYGGGWFNFIQPPRPPEHTLGVQRHFYGFTL